MRQLSFSVLTVLGCTTLQVPVAHAASGLDSFVAICVTASADPDRLTNALGGYGFVEIDPSTGPRLMAGLPGRARLWGRGRTGNGKSDSYIGLQAEPGRQPAKLCWEVSASAETAAQALPALQRLYPPVGKPHRGSWIFYGGYESWDARVEGRAIALRVDWPSQANPARGPAVFEVLVFDPPATKP